MGGFAGVAASLKGRQVPALPAAARGAVGGSIVAFVAFLLAAELLLGIGESGHEVRVGLLMGLLISTVALAGMLHPGELQSHPAESKAADAAYASAPGTSVPIEGVVQVRF